MTPLQAIDRADSVEVVFGLAMVPGEVEIRITKQEAKRLIRAHKLPFEDVMHEIGHVRLDGSTATIHFHT
ncbi:hypothetical protein [Pararhizobium sp.]|uniref:hypothetical protein n=1 Tax=Pararhizobium sp. TaxID=1977563 RepID=UPI003D0DACDA